MQGGLQFYRNQSAFENQVHRVGCERASGPGTYGIGHLDCRPLETRIEHTYSEAVTAPTEEYTDVLYTYGRWPREDRRVASGSQGSRTPNRDN